MGSQARHHGATKKLDMASDNPIAQTSLIKQNQLYGNNSTLKDKNQKGDSQGAKSQGTTSMSGKKQLQAQR